MQNFSARETEWLLELDGVELAGFRRRAIAFVVDVALAYMAVFGLEMVFRLLLFLIRLLTGHPASGHHTSFFRGGGEHRSFLPGTFLTVLYFGLLTWRGKGRSPGKRFMKIRVVSLVHRHLSLWHSIERALGYGAALLEGGFGFFQYFIHPYRRTIQDRIAETIVVTENGYQLMQHKLSHPLLPDDGMQPAARLADEIPVPEPPPKLEAGF
jgi:uncharacterized RDD family membrane protein YckC